MQLAPSPGTDATQGHVPAKSRSVWNIRPMPLSQCIDSIPITTAWLILVLEQTLAYLGELCLHTHAEVVTLSPSERDLVWT